MIRKCVGRKIFYLRCMTASSLEPAADHRIVPLEAIRGFAAVAVVVYHGLLSFAPQAINGGHSALQPVWEFIFGLVNGGAAVTLFFVLSGFVLSLPFTRAPASASVSGKSTFSRMGLAMTKRWPRLAGLTVLGCLSGWVLVQLSGNAYVMAARISGANWLASHANSPLSPRDPLTWHGAVHEGLLSIFTRGDVHYDSALWTMRIELFCSLAIFALAPLLFALRRWWIRILLLWLIAAAVGARYPLTYLTDFLCGATLALLASEGRLPELGRSGAALLSLIVLFSFGFSGTPDLSLYAPLRAVLPSGDSNHFVWEIGAVALMIAVLGFEPVYRALCRPWAARLGVLSFPLYVIHVPILLSLGAASFILGAKCFSAAAGAALAMIVTLTASFSLAMPLAWADRHWCGAIRRTMQSVALLGRSALSRETVS